MRRLAALALLLVACNPLAPAATPTPPLPTEFVIPTPSPAPTHASLTGHYGFIVATGTGYTVRREDSPTALGSFDLVNIAVSPEGNLVAGWTRNTPAELRLLDVRDPATTRRILTLPTGERGGAMTWSIDGSGLLYSAETELVTEGGAPAHAALRTIDLGAASAAPKDLARFDAMQLRPMEWDRLGGDLVTALGVVPGTAREYIVIRGTDKPEERSLPADRKWQEAPAVSGDGRWVMIPSLLDSTLRTFRADDPGFILETHGLVANASVSALGRPFGGQLGVVLDRQLIFWDPQTNSRALVQTPGDVFGIVCWRFDGTAAVIKTAAGLALVDPSGKTTPLSGDVRFGIALP
ncbi:MAG TPA: hypothetical protein VEU77_07240 [Candidatus Acidoferrales bacterium]|nr:hypothetical protein [Candidatus Acidoferrales bacterium]